MNWFIETIVKPWHPTILGIVVVAPLLYFGLPISPPHLSETEEEDVTDRVSRVTCRKVEVGMTEEEVKKILAIPGEELTLMERRPDCEFLTRWYGKGFEFFVSYDAKHKVTSARIHLRRPGNIGC